MFWRSSNRRAFGADLLTITVRVLYVGVTEVKGRSSRHRDRGGLDAFGACKRRKLARAISCWRADHPEHAHQMLQVVLALVPLDRPTVPIRWLLVDQLG